MVYTFQGVKNAASGAYYYDEHDFQRVKVPLADCQGDYILSKDELKRYFGLDAERLGPIPEYLIAPRLNSTRNGSRSNTTGRSWWDITGEVVAYKPIAWVPIVRERSTIPLSHFEVEFEKKSTTIQTSELYGKAETTFTMSVGVSYKGVKVELSTTTHVEAHYSTSAEVKEEITRKDKVGFVKELIMGLGLRVQRVFERNVALYLDDKARGDSLTWRGPESWNDVHIPASALRDVDFLQFHPIHMTGTGHSSSLWLQVLPSFDSLQRLTDLNIAVSCAGWTDWYAYIGGTKTVNSGRTETLPVPNNKKPQVTFIAVT